MTQCSDNGLVCDEAVATACEAKETKAILPEHPFALRAEHHEGNPLGLGCARPRLSWKLPVEIGGRRVLRQVAWQVRADGLFDTGRRAGSESVFVEWPGETLRSRQRVSWQVRVWLCVEEGVVAVTGWSDAAVFETGLLSREDWSAKWIGWGDAGEKDTPPSPLLRRPFAVKARPVRARLYAAALGLFEFWINGAAAHPKVVLAGGWTDFRKRVQVYTFDVTTLMRSGENVLGTILADGWYAGYLSCDGQRHIYGGAPALLAQLEIEYENGEIQRVVSDDSWVGRTGPLLSADLYHGEHYDARLELAGWSCSGFQAGGAWEPVYLRPWPDSLILDPRVAEPVQRIEERVAHVVTEPSAGVFIFDFGQNFSGWVRLCWSGKRGQKIVMRFGEMLNPDGSLYTANLRTARATDCYVFGGDETATWEPRFTFHGFRYVEVSGLALPDGAHPPLEAVTGIVVHNAMRVTGQFRCSDERVNRLTENIRWSLRSNFLEIPTDCPQRDERLGWSCDIQVFAKTAAFFYDTDAFLTKWLRDLRDGQLEDGAFPDLAPTFICGFGNAAWADAGVIVPWVVYRRFGDISVLEENYESMCAWIRFQEETSRNGIRPPTVYGDWLALDAVRPEHAPVPSDFVGTAYFARTCAIMVQVARVLGRTGDAQRFENLRCKVVTAFQKEFVTPGGRLAGECQTAYALALAFDLLPEDKRYPAVQRLVALIEKHKGHLSTGFVGTPLLCPVLSRFGRHDAAMRLLLQAKYPSWLYTVAQGATTIWERWNSFTPDQGFGDEGMNSFNHYAFGAIGEWLVHFVAGIAPGPEASAYRHIVFRPQPCAGLESTEASLETPYGRASISWWMNGPLMEGTLEVPPGAFADFEGGAFARWHVDGGHSRRLAAGRYGFEGSVGQESQI